MRNRNQLILFGYLAVFFVVVSLYDFYKENTYLVALAAVILSVLGLLAWVWSVQGRKDDEDK
jgi:hypothetical protein